MKLTKSQFKKRWEKDEDGGGLTFDDIAACAINWGILSKPRIHPMQDVCYKVLKAAGVSDAEDYKP